MINFRNSGLVRDGFTRPDDDEDEDGPTLTEDGEPIYRSVNCSRCGKRTSYDPIYEDLCASCCRADNE